MLAHPDRPHIYYSELYPAKPSFPTDFHTHTCLVAAEDNQYKKITTFLEKYNIHDIITCVTKKKGNIINIMIIG